MKLTRQVVANVLEDLGYEWDFDPYGFLIKNAQLRVQNASGIAGMLNHWWLFDLATNKPASGLCVNKTELKQAFKRWNNKT